MGTAQSLYVGAPPPRQAKPLSKEGEEAEIWKTIAARVPKLEQGGDDGSSSRKVRVAIVGSGVTGLGAAYHLVKQASDIEVTVYESSSVPGGHAHTVETKEGVAVDTGFMVFNYENYPNMVEMFQELGVEDEDTCMSFAVSMDGGAIEWSSDNVRTLTGQPYVTMVRDMLRFHRIATSLLHTAQDDPDRHLSLQEYLNKHGFSDAFVSYYIVPMCAALWSSSNAQVLASSAYAMIAFMDNHCMLQMFNRPQWKTPAGRSRVYVDKIASLLGPSLRLNCGVTSVTTAPTGSPGGRLVVTDTNKGVETFDHVIFACHPDQALSILGSNGASEEVRSLLSPFKYADNKVVLHSDPRLMPKSEAAWASWNYIGTTTTTDSSSTTTDSSDSSKPVFVTYWLNKLQNLKTDQQVFVSLNPTIEPKPELVHKVLHMGHPQFTPSTTKAQGEVNKCIQGVGGVWFAGAWMGFGFHEDGLRTGLQVATAISGRPVSWVAPESSTAVIPVSKASLSARGLVAQAQDLMGYYASGALSVFLRGAIKRGLLVLRLPGSGKKLSFGDLSCPVEDRVVLCIKSWWFFVRVALEYDLGLARSYMAGDFEVERTGPNSDGLTRLFLLFIKNRDQKQSGLRVSSLVTSWLGYGLNFLRYRLSMDNSVTGSRSNISAHYDIGNDLYSLFLDTDNLMMYSSAIYDLHVHTTTTTTTKDDDDKMMMMMEGQQQVVPPSPTAMVLSNGGVVRGEFRGTLEEAQTRKVDTLLSRCGVEAHHTLLDIGFGWGGVAIRAAETIGCRVVGITLSVEQKALAEAKVRAKGLQHLITFHLVDYRVFAKQHPGEFDRIISCEMIEAVGHQHLGEYFAAVERLLVPDGIFVMEAITTPESRYTQYLKSTDFINTVIFPGSCCPSLTALLSAMATHSHLSLEALLNIDVHYAQTLKEWRYRFNRHLDTVKTQGFDDVFIRCWNYYFCYCEAAFASKTEGCLILTFSRPGNPHLYTNTPCTITTITTNTGKKAMAAAAAAAAAGTPLLPATPQAAAAQPPPPAGAVKVPHGGTTTATSNAAAAHLLNKQ